MKSNMNDVVNHPSHYTSQEVECIEITQNLNFLLGNAVKYIWRFQDKNGREDLEKAKWYLKRQLNTYLDLRVSPQKSAELLTKIAGLNFLPEQAKAIACILNASIDGSLISLVQAYRYVEALQARVYQESCHEKN
jgi:hypothetical protein